MNDSSVKFGGRRTHLEVDWTALEIWANSDPYRKDFEENNQASGIDGWLEVPKENSKNAEENSNDEPFNPDHPEEP